MEGAAGAEQVTKPDDPLDLWEREAQEHIAKGYWGFSQAGRVLRLIAAVRKYREAVVTVGARSSGLTRELAAEAEAFLSEARAEGDK